jgi:hypothetical protein
MWIMWIGIGIMWIEDPTLLQGHAGLITDPEFCAKTDEMRDGNETLDILQIVLLYLLQIIWPVMYYKEVRSTLENRELVETYSSPQA